MISLLALRLGPVGKDNEVICYLCTMRKESWSGKQGRETHGSISLSMLDQGDLNSDSCSQHSCFILH